MVQWFFFFRFLCFAYLLLFFNKSLLFSFSLLECVTVFLCCHCTWICHNFHLLSPSNGFCGKINWATHLSIFKQNSTISSEYIYTHIWMCWLAKVTRLIVLNHFSLKFFYMKCDLCVDQCVVYLSRLCVCVACISVWDVRSHREHRLYIGSVRARSTYTFFRTHFAGHWDGVCAPVCRCSVWLTSCVFRLVHLLGRLFLMAFMLNFVVAVFFHNIRITFQFLCVWWICYPITEPKFEVTNERESRNKKWSEWMMPSKQVNLN